MNNEKLKSKKEYYFRQYFNQSEVIRKRREIIEELNLTKKEILENPIYISAVNYDSMPHNPNVNKDSILDRVIKTDDKIENINNNIAKQIKQLKEELLIFEKIDSMLQELTENQFQVFELTYKEGMKRKEVAYILNLTIKSVQNAKKAMLKKANFIQEN